MLINNIISAVNKSGNDPVESELTNFGRIFEQTKPHGYDVETFATALIVNQLIEQKLIPTTNFDIEISNKVKDMVTYINEYQPCDVRRVVADVKEFNHVVVELMNPHMEPLDRISSMIYILGWNDECTYYKQRPQVEATSENVELPVEIREMMGESVPDDVERPLVVDGNDQPEPLKEEVTVIVSADEVPSEQVLSELEDIRPAVESLWGNLSERFLTRFR